MGYDKYEQESAKTKMSKKINEQDKFERGIRDYVFAVVVTLGFR